MRTDLSVHDVREHAVREAFAAHGYAGAHVAILAEAAAMSVSTFYTHFGSKERAYQLVMGEDPPKQSASAPSLTGRALRTRNAIVVAARVCIERDGYHAARITDIAEQAGVAVGTFYTYFSSKDDVFAEVLDRAVAELQDSTPETLSQPTDGSGRDHRPYGAEDAVANIRTAVERYLELYGKYAMIDQRMQEAIASSPGLIPVRLGVHQAFAQRIAQSLRRWQNAGIADPELDPDHAGHALAAMVGHSTRVWISYGQPHDHDAAVATLTRLWANSVGLVAGASNNQS